MPDEPKVLMLQLSDARTRAQDAYMVARDVVFDVYPDGLPGPHELSEEQRAAIEQLHAAEEEVRRLRRALHGAVDERARSGQD